MDSLFTNIMFWSPLVCVILLIICIKQDKKIDKLKAELNLQDVPVIIKLKQEESKLAQDKIKAECARINLDIEKRIREGEFYLKLPKKPFVSCIKSVVSDYVWLRYKDHKMEVVGTGGFKAELSAQWMKEPR